MGKGIHLETTISTQAFIKDQTKLFMGEGARIDSFVRISTTCHIGRFTHICNGVSIAGGLENVFKIGDHSALSAGAKIWLQSDDYVNDALSIVTHSSLEGNIIMEHFTGIGSNSVVMPGTYFPEGAVVGALSFVPYQFPLEPWTVYAGCPIRKIKPRNREQVLETVSQAEEEIKKLKRTLELQ